MLRHILIGLILTILAIICAPQIAAFLHFIGNLHHAVASYLGSFIHGGYIAALARASLALFLIPLIVALIPAFIYWLVTRREFYYFGHIFWITWLLLLAVIV